MKGKKRKNSIEKWDEISGTLKNTSGNEDTDDFSDMEDGLVIQENSLREVEDLLEQNDNNLDGIINNLPEDKSIEKQFTSQNKEEEVRKSLIEKIQERVKKDEKDKMITLDDYEKER